MHVCGLLPPCLPASARLAPSGAVDCRHQLLLQQQDRSCAVCGAMVAGASPAPAWCPAACAVAVILGRHTATALAATMEPALAVTRLFLQLELTVITQGLDLDASSHAQEAQNGKPGDWQPGSIAAVPAGSQAEFAGMHSCGWYALTWLEH